MNTPQRFEFDADGALVQRGTGDWREPICPECHEPIAYVLDMMSFSSYRRERGGYVLVHARCAWQPDAFERERHAAKLRLSALTGKEQGQPDPGKFFGALAPTRTLTYQPPTGKGQE